VSIVTGIVSKGLGGDVGDSYYPLQSGQTPIADTGFKNQSGTDIAALFMPISYGSGTSTMSGFKSNNHAGNDLSLLFSTSSNLTVSVSVIDAECPYQTTGTQKCCNPGDINFTITASGGSGGYSYSTTLTSSEGGYVLNGANTSTPYLSTSSCLTGTTIYSNKIQVTVTDSKGNQVTVDAGGKATVTANT
jgi:hypothetical protein